MSRTTKNERSRGVYRRFKKNVNLSILIHKMKFVKDSSGVTHDKDKLISENNIYMCVCRPPPAPQKKIKVLLK